MSRIPIELIGDEGEIRFRDCLSLRYIQSAALFCRLAYSIEKEYSRTKELGPEDNLMHEAFALHAVLSAVSFLEALINELYSDATDDMHVPDEGKTRTLFQTIAAEWRNGKNFDRAPLLTKYQRILALSGSHPFPESDPAFANIRKLVAIRNFLLHYRKEWVVTSKRRRSSGDETTEAERFETMLSHAFRENPLALKGRPFFPDRCLGHGCAEWAVINSLIVADTFFAAIGIPAPYEGIKNDLATR
ncbi:MAG TPA: hypothetical protein P5217_00605 [Methanoregulaceae archaeon]|nr:hypothetical protein [Methanoregulaceae archaeon]